MRNTDYFKVIYEVFIYLLLKLFFLIVLFSLIVYFISILKG